MVYYFSGTGNSRAVAAVIAAATSDRACDITHPACPAPRAGETLGLVMPVYFWGLPEVCRRFAESLPGQYYGYVYAVATYGTTSGGFSKMMRKMLGKRGIRLDAAFGVKMVDIWTPMFDCSDRPRCLEKTQKALEHTRKVAEAVNARVKGDFTAGRVPLWLARAYHSTYDGARRCSHFSLDTAKCISCGRCWCNCPATAIAPDCERHPRWTAERCQMCLRCLHGCPAFAISRGRASMRHGQWLTAGHPNLLTPQERFTLDNTPRK